MHGANCFCQLAAGYPRHLQIYEQYVRTGCAVAGQQIQGRAGVGGAHHLVTLMGQQERHQFKADGIVIHEEDLMPGLFCDGAG